MNLKNKVVVITGAAGGMGRVTVEKVLNFGGKVVGLDINIDSLQALKEQYKEDLLVIKTDITSEESVNSSVQQAVKTYGQVDVLVNIAGIAQAATEIENVTLEDWYRILNINTTSVFLTSRAVVPFMKKKRQGVIINIASISAERPRPGLNAYIASKGATISLTKALAIELAPYNIRVNAINPGPADTQMLGEFTATGTNVEEAKENIFKKSVPLGRLIIPEDIANSIVYLSSDLATMITGSVLNVDGGRGI
ncbi:SDR family NAD(P)-dependent oxidoreductase [Sporosarcina siberiensis]|uniref:SDR family NAD(P)-dependent oxidoreductase n=1 Tax=Sporosarcina siberiensis TaxID=1365606 RepID=A0ABW4SGE9_9BACL